MFHIIVRLWRFLIFREMKRVMQKVRGWNEEVGWLVRDIFCFTRSPFHFFSLSAFVSEEKKKMGYVVSHYTGLSFLLLLVCFLRVTVISCSTNFTRHHRHYHFVNLSSVWRVGYWLEQKAQTEVHYYFFEKRLPKNCNIVNNVR